MTDLHSEHLDAAIEEDGAAIARDHFKPGDLSVVTGGARGFGRAISKRLAREGARLAIWDLLDDEGEETAEMCRQAGAEVEFFHCDMGVPNDIASAAAAVIQRFGPAYAVVNNAGINLRTSAIDHPVEMWNKTLAVNLVGSFLCSQAFAREMIKAGRGSIINFASGRAIQGAVNSISYAASKAGIIAMTKTQASEWAVHGIRVNAVVPGVSETRQPLEAGGTLEELRQRGKSIPLGRVGHPDDIAGMVVLLLSEDAAYITGQSIAINGGRIMLP
ncbi:MAG: SDR family NAD(P)-dependent oxidoreductase [Alphaproteobacteria bacterium]|nr:SDR family NAD(P)-dependent oxidoreductase [Alphaproteobacteria bacterium]MCZ6847283.1 SDR family NAD(P)-dependent oxidoreductase [Alphaproteobacteria bacterium]